MSMRFFLLITMFLVLPLAGIVFFFTRDISNSTITSTPIDTHSSIHLTKKNVEEDRYIAMQAEYKQVEKARRNMERRLADIKALMWGLELPTEQAKQIIRTIKKGYALLKFKKLFGAFSGVTGIRDELEQIMYIDHALQDIVTQIKVARAKATEQPIK